MKKFLFIISIILVVFTIYLFANKENQIVFSLGTNDGDINYIPKEYRITDIIIDIENNINIEGYDIQNLLVKSKHIKIDLNSYINLKDYHSVLSQVEDLEVLIKTIRKYSKENITFKLLDEKNILYEYANKKILLLSKKYDIMVVR